MFENKMSFSDKQGTPGTGKKLSPWLGQRLAKARLMYTRLPLSMSNRAINRWPKRKLRPLAATSVIALRRTTDFPGIKASSNPSSWKKLELSLYKKHRQLNQHTDGEPQEIAMNWPESIDRNTENTLVGNQRDTYHFRSEYQKGNSKSMTTDPDEMPRVQTPNLELKPGLTRSIQKQVVTMMGNPVKTSLQIGRIDEVIPQPVFEPAAQKLNSDTLPRVTGKRELRSGQSEYKGPSDRRFKSPGIQPLRSLIGSDLFHSVNLRRVSQTPSGSFQSTGLRQAYSPAVQPAQKPPLTTTHSKGIAIQLDRSTWQTEKYQPLALKPVVPPASVLDWPAIKPVAGVAFPPAVTKNQQQTQIAGQQVAAGTKDDQPTKQNSQYQPLELKPVVPPLSVSARSTENPVSLEAASPAVSKSQPPPQVTGRKEANQIQMDIQQVKTEKLQVAKPSAGLYRSTEKQAARGMHPTPVMREQKSVMRVVPILGSVKQFVSTIKPITRNYWVGRSETPSLKLNSKIQGTVKQHQTAGKRIVSGTSSVTDPEVAEAFALDDRRAENTSQFLSQPTSLSSNPDYGQSFSEMQTIGAPDTNIMSSKRIESWDINGSHEINPVEDHHLTPVLPNLNQSTGRSRLDKRLTSASLLLPNRTNIEEITDTISHRSSASEAPPIQMYSMIKRYLHQPILPLSDNGQRFSQPKFEKPAGSIPKSRVYSVSSAKDKPANLEHLDLSLTTRKRTQVDAGGNSDFENPRALTTLNPTIFRQPEGSVTQRSFLPVNSSSKQTEQSLNPAAEAGANEAKTDLKALAREVYPYIKRMIIVDRERRPS
jgi:hypothetical protein